MRTALSRLAAAAIAGLLVVAGAPAADAQPARPDAAGFAVFTNERTSTTPGLQQYGATRATVAYDAFHLTCDANGCYANGGALPDQATFSSDIQMYVGEFGGSASAPIVLDYENIVLTALSGQAATNALALWKRLVAWTHDAEPAAPVGMYGYDWSTTNNALTAQLHGSGLLDFFAPRAYWNAGQTQADWDATIDAAVSNDRSLAPGQPIYPYVTDWYINGGALASYHTDHVFTHLEAETDGMVWWEPQGGTAAYCPTTGEISYQLSVVTGTRSSGPLAAVAAPPSGSCAVPRGATTDIPVTVTNTSTAGTAATTMQSFGSTLPQGIGATWQYWDVPALAPGASWQTALELTVPSGETWSSVLLHLRTGLSDTRFAAVVTG